LGDFRVICHEKERVDSFFTGKTLDTTKPKTSIRAQIPRRYNRLVGAAKFFGQVFWSCTNRVVAAFIALEEDFRYTEDPFRRNSMSIPAIACERKEAKAILLFF
jgi:hypothetical protein